MIRFFRRFVRHRANASMVILISLLCISCERIPVDPAPALIIMTPQPIHAGVIIWNPNERPLLSLSATGDLPDGVLDSLIWRQRGWQVDDSAWRGRDLRVSITTPGCGYGGTTFEISVTTPGRSHERVVQVQMLPYICAGIGG